MSEPLPDTRTAPLAVQVEMKALRNALDAQIPPKRDVERNILIATWNIRAFGGLTEKWQSSSRDSPKRNWRGLHAIAEIISRFDVVAVQEIIGDLAALRTLIKTLGPNWDFLITDVNLGSKGNVERAGFLFDSRRIKLSGLAGELSTPGDPEVLAKLSPNKPFRQFARTPYAVSFRAGLDTFILVMAHVIFGDGPEDRTAELSAIANWMADWARRTSRFHHNLLVLGDFNIDRRGDKNFEAFVSSGLEVPPALNDVPRTIFGGGSNGQKFYDQIAWFANGRRRKLSLEFVLAGGFDFSDLLFQADPKLTRQSMSFRISDHLPLWAEFRSAAAIG